MEKQIWTIGHSTKLLNEFLELLHTHGIELLADVRRFPGSRKHPQFLKGAMEQSLPENGIAYRHFPELGGRRRPENNGRNSIWRNKAFKGDADYMATDYFQEGLEQLVEVTAEKPTAMMCSEVLWWRCHRSLISDLLKSKGYTVNHIMSPVKIQEHPFTSAARVVEGKLSYDE
ncbi:DUF488 domain-containing protein [Nafulsella turpanensis]|uniref:DUF488 domain-containing protein n=1 Tax=Nafulsella turpanensis TaxID=1265690 RepID=UPI000349D67B|nr:DUF488 domain-containing protein [Nafulsella turpanensis]